MPSMLDGAGYKKKDSEKAEIYQRAKAMASSKGGDAAGRQWSR